MATIRRNATRKIRALAATAKRVRTWDHGDQGVAGTLEGDAIESALADWFAWSSERGKRTSCHAGLREGVKRYGHNNTLRVQTVLTLAYHSNRGIDFILEDEPADGEAPNLSERRRILELARVFRRQRTAHSVRVATVLKSSLYNDADADDATRAIRAALEALEMNAPAEVA